MLNRLQGVFASLHRHDVKYVVIGGIVAVLHGVPRATFDLDIMIEATSENAQHRFQVKQVMVMRSLLRKGGAAAPRFCDPFTRNRTMQSSPDVQGMGGQGSHNLKNLVQLREI